MGGSHQVCVSDADRGSGGTGFLLTLLLAPFLAQVDATIANVATPAIRDDLGATAPDAALVVGTYLVAYAVLLITGARLGRLRGYRVMFVVGMSGFAISSLAAGLAGSVQLLVAARAVQGAFAALMYPQTLTGIQVNYSGPARAKAVRLMAIALASGAVVGQALGGVLVDADLFGFTWRPIFLINVPIVAVGLGIASRTLRQGRTQTADATPELDLGGALLLSVATVLLVVPLIIGPDRHWPAWSLIALVMAAPGWMVFVAHQRRRARNHRAPLVNIAVVSTRPVLTGLGALLLATGTYLAVLFVLAQFVQRGLGESPLVSGLVLIPWVAAFGLAGQLIRLLPPCLGPWLPMTGYLLLSAAFVLIGLSIGAGAGVGMILVILLALGGLGLGTGFATLIVHLTESVAPSHAADISGVAATTLQIGGALGLATLGTLYGELRGSPASAFMTTMLGAAVVAAAAAGLARAATRPAATPSAEPIVVGGRSATGSPRAETKQHDT